MPRRAEQNPEREEETTPMEDPIEETGGEDQPEPERPRWRAGNPEEQVYVETGRGSAVQVAAGSPFAETIDRLANEANYGGYYRVFLNADEILDPAEAPETLEPGMRVAITPYDKVG